MPKFKFRHHYEDSNKIISEVGTYPNKSSANATAKMIADKNPNIDWFSVKQIFKRKLSKRLRR